MIEYWNENWPIMLDDVQQHATMVLSSLAIALVIAVVIIGGTILLRYVGTDNISLYLVTVLAAMFNVVIYGVA